MKISTVHVTTLKPGFGHGVCFILPLPIIAAGEARESRTVNDFYDQRVQFFIDRALEAGSAPVADNPSIRPAVRVRGDLVTELLRAQQRSDINMG